LNKEDLETLTKLSVRESLIAVYETFYTWGAAHEYSNSMIFKIKNNFLFKNKLNNNYGLIAVSIHNRSVDMLLKWINSQVPTTSLYKKVKIGFLDNFIKNDRQHNGAKCFETSLKGVKNVFKALKEKKVVCFAADQVPQRGMGEYIKFYGRDAYSTTLVQSLVRKTKAEVLYVYLNSSSSGFIALTINPLNKSTYEDSKYKLSLNSDIENLINKRPVDYSWEYKRFKKNKNDLLDPYKDI
jgi:KDO2-lipid IV(A) lauroyltransferase